MSTSPGSRHPPSAAALCCVLAVVLVAAQITLGVLTLRLGLSQPAVTVAHQCIAVQYLLELSKQLDVDPRSCISSFFTKIQKADPEYKKAFDDELAAFKLRIRNRAKEKVEEQMEELRKEEEKERLERLGPGGLDPAEVFEALPKEMQECFESQDIAKLQAVIAAMKPEDARYHMKRCVDSGLWKPAADDPNTNPEDGFKRQPVEEQDNNTYESVN